MKEKFHPINRNITVTILIYTLLMGIGLSFLTYRIYANSFYERYRIQMKSILSYVGKSIDIDDMSECAKTMTESPKYKETSAFFDDFVDNYPDLHYLYILKAYPAGEPVRVRSVCSANTTYEKENDPENVVKIGDGDEDWYSDEIADRLLDIQNGNEDVYFVQPSAWGRDYTLARPLIDSKGDHYALLCVDIAMDELESTVYKSFLVNLAVVALFGVLLMILLIIWIRLHITDPLKKLQDSVSDFADASRGRNNPDDLLFISPELKINNEIKALSEAVTRMSMNMRDYAKRTLATQKKVEGLEGYVEKINDVAYFDPLTRVKNRAAYEEKVEALENDMFNRVAQFAVLMADLNNLKKINDKYGHDKGNEYILGSCRIISDIYKHSPIFRIGGDEFVVILEERDYKNRDELIKTAREHFAQTSSDESAEPWKRYSAALGMSVYVSDEDYDYETVFKRADEAMYDAKVKMKAPVKKIVVKR